MENANHWIAIPDLSQGGSRALRSLRAKQHKPYQTYIHGKLEQAAGKKVALNCG